MNGSAAPILKITQVIVAVIVPENSEGNILLLMTSLKQVGIWTYFGSFISWDMNLPFPLLIKINLSVFVIEVHVLKYLLTEGLKICSYGMHS